MNKHDGITLALSCLLGLSIGAGISIAVMYFFSDRTIKWNGGKYTGETKDGIPDGEGIFERDGMTYSGIWAEGDLCEGKIKSSRYVYDGEIENLKLHGYGTCHYNDGNIYRGYWKNDMKDGLGRMERNGKISCSIYKDGIAVVPQGQVFEFGERVYGIDVSIHQSTIDWQDVFLSCNKYGGVDGKAPADRPYMQPVLFAIAKSTQGNKKKDPTFDTNMEAIRRCGIILGAFHFLTLNVSGKSQAEFFIRNTPLRNGDLPPILDIEKNTYDKPLPTDEEFKNIIPIAKEWIADVEQYYGVKPIIYTNLDIYKKFISNDDMLKKLPLWLANPGTKRPDIENCILWQFTHNGKVNGIAENIVDINMFYGNMKEFRNFIRKNEIKSGM